MSNGPDYIYPPEGFTAGRCKPCGFLFFWRARKGRRLKQASCPRCLRMLAQTTAANLRRVNVAINTAEPLFGVPAGEVKT